MYYLRKKLVRSTKRALGLATFPPARYRHLYEEVERVRPSTILEIGTNDGINAVELVKAARRAGREAAYFGFDLFEALADADLNREFSIKTRSRQEVDAYLRREGVSGARLFAGDTRKTLPEAAPALPRMDLVFIDGGHSYETVKSDWENVQGMVDSKGSVIFDDHPNFGIGRVVDAIDRNKWDVTIFPTVDRFPVRNEFSDGSSHTTMGVQLARARLKA